MPGIPVRVITKKGEEAFTIGEWKDAVIANGAALSGEVNLGMPYDTLLIAIPAITASQVSIQVAEATEGTFQPLHITEGDGTSAPVLSDAGTGVFTWNIPLGGFQFIKVATSVNQGAARTFRVCGRN